MIINVFQFLFYGCNILARILVIDVICKVIIFRKGRHNEPKTFYMSGVQVSQIAQEGFLIILLSYNCNTK